MDPFQYTKLETAVAEALYSGKDGFFVDFLRGKEGTVYRIFDAFRDNNDAKVKADKLPLNMTSQMLPELDLKLAVHFDGTPTVNEQMLVSLLQRFLVRGPRLVVDLDEGFSVDYNTVISLARSSDKSFRWNVVFDTSVISKEEQETLGLVLEETYKPVPERQRLRTVEKKSVPPSPSRFILYSGDKELLNINLANLGTKDVVPRQIFRAMACTAIVRVFNYISVARIIVAAASSFSYGWNNLRSRVPALSGVSLRNFLVAIVQKTGIIYDKKKLRFLEEAATSVNAYVKRQLVSVSQKLDADGEAQLDVITVFERISENALVMRKSVLTSISDINSHKLVVLKNMNLPRSTAATFSEDLGTFLGKQEQVLMTANTNETDKIRVDAIMDAYLRIAKLAENLSGIPPSISPVPAEYQQLFKRCREDLDRYGIAVSKIYVLSLANENKKCAEESPASRAVYLSLIRAGSMSDNYYPGSLVALMTQSNSLVYDILATSDTLSFVQEAMSGFVSCIQRENKEGLWTYMRTLWNPLFRGTLTSTKSIGGEIDKKSFPQQSIIFSGKTADYIADELVAERSVARILDRELRRSVVFAFQQIQAITEPMSHSPEMLQRIASIKSELQEVADALFGRELVADDYKTIPTSRNDVLTRRAAIEKAVGLLEALRISINTGVFQRYGVQEPQPPYEVLDPTESRVSFGGVLVGVRRAAWFGTELLRFLDSKGKKFVIEPSEVESYDLEREASRLEYERKFNVYTNGKLGALLKSQLDSALQLVQSTGLVDVAYKDSTISKLTTDTEAQIDELPFSSDQKTFARLARIPLKRMRMFYQTAATQEASRSVDGTSAEFLRNFVNAYKILAAVGLLAREEHQLSLTEGLPAAQQTEMYDSVKETERFLGERVVSALRSVMTLPGDNSAELFLNYLDLLDEFDKTPEKRRPPIRDASIFDTFIQQNKGTVTANVDALRAQVSVYFDQRYAPPPAVPSEIGEFVIEPAEIARAYEELREVITVQHISDSLPRVPSLYERIVRKLGKDYGEFLKQTTSANFVVGIQLVTVDIRELFYLLKSHEPVKATAEFRQLVERIRFLEQTIVVKARVLAGLIIDVENRDVIFDTSNILDEALRDLGVEPEPMVEAALPGGLSVLKIGQGESVVPQYDETGVITFQDVLDELNSRIQEYADTGKLPDDYEEQVLDLFDSIRFRLVFSGTDEEKAREGRLYVQLVSAYRAAADQADVRERAIILIRRFKEEPPTTKESKKWSYALEAQNLAQQTATNLWLVEKSGTTIQPLFEYMPVLFDVYRIWIARTQKTEQGISKALTAIAPYEGKGTKESSAREENARVQAIKAKTKEAKDDLKQIELDTLRIAGDVDNLGEETEKRLAQLLELERRAKLVQSQNAENTQLLVAVNEFLGAIPDLVQQLYNEKNEPKLERVFQTAGIILQDLQNLSNALSPQQSPQSGPAGPPQTGPMEETTIPTTPLATTKPPSSAKPQGQSGTKRKGTESGGRRAATPSTSALDQIQSAVKIIVTEISLRRDVSVPSLNWKSGDDLMDIITFVRTKEKLTQEDYVKKLDYIARLALNTYTAIENQTFVVLVFVALMFNNALIKVTGENYDKFLAFVANEIARGIYTRSDLGLVQYAEVVRDHPKDPVVQDKDFRDLYLTPALQTLERSSRKRTPNEPTMDFISDVITKLPYFDTTTTTFRKPENLTSEDIKWSAPDFISTIITTQPKTVKHL